MRGVAQLHSVSFGSLLCLEGFCAVTWERKGENSGIHAAAELLGLKDSCFRCFVQLEGRYVVIHLGLCSFSALSPPTPTPHKVWRIVEVGTWKTLPGYWGVWHGFRL